MHCSDFLAHYSDYQDGELTPAEAELFDHHLQRCRSCARYRRVVQRGVDLLRGFPAPEPRADLRERIRHSVYREEAADRRGRLPLPPSGAMAAAGLATLITVVVGTQLLQAPEPTVELPPIVASVPVVTRLPESFPRPYFFTPRAEFPTETLFAESDLWTGSNTLLYEYSTLGRRHRESGIVRTGLQ